MINTFRVATMLVVFLAAAAPAFAQDFKTEWLDRVTHMRQVEDAPVPALPFTYDLSAGFAVFSNDNIFLSDKKETDDVIWVPYARVKLEYAEPNAEAVLDSVVSYSHYASEDDESGAEWRTFGQVRTIGSNLRAEVTEILQRRSDPLDVVFIDNAELWISNTMPRLSFDIENTWVTVELSANIQIVQFDDDLLGDARDNVNTRVFGSVIYESPWEYDLVLEVGGTQIRYLHHQPVAPPDSSGSFVRAGIRGELVPGLHVEALVGGTEIESHDYPNGTPGTDDSSAEVAIHVQWDATETVTVLADYDRLYTFAGGIDPYQLTSRFLAIVEYQAMAELLLRGRVQYDVSKSALGVDRTYATIGLGGTYQVDENIVIDGGLTHRLGDIEGAVVTSIDYDNTVFQLGASYQF